MNVPEPLNKQSPQWEKGKRTGRQTEKVVNQRELDRYLSPLTDLLEAVRDLTSDSELRWAQLAAPSRINEQCWAWVWPESSYLSAAELANDQKVTLCPGVWVLSASGPRGTQFSAQVVCQDGCRLLLF